MNNWLLLDREQIRGEVDPESKGLKINIFTSPYDIPEAVRGYVDSTQKKYIIEFKYINEEELKTVKEDECISLGIGKKSGRIYNVTIDIQSLNLSKGEYQFKTPQIIEKAIDKLEADIDSRQSRKKENYIIIKKDKYEIAKKIIYKNNNKIFEGLTV